MVFELKTGLRLTLGGHIRGGLVRGASITQLATQVLDQLTTVAATPSVSLTRVQKTTAEHPLSFAQQRLWFVNHWNRYPYNIPVAVHLTGRLNMC